MFQASLTAALHGREATWASDRPPIKQGWRSSTSTDPSGDRQKRLCFAFLSPLIRHPLTFTEEPALGWLSPAASMGVNCHGCTGISANVPEVSPPNLPTSQ